MKTTILPLLACLLLVTGCSYQDFDKPLLFNPVRALFATRRSPTYFDTVDRAELARMREGVLIWQKQSISDEREYAVGVGDELEISVSVPTQIESIATVKQRVAANGEISCPFIGQVQAIGHSITELQRRLVGLYGDGYVKNPIITVSVTKYNSKRYLLTVDPVGNISPCVCMGVLEAHVGDVRTDDLRTVLRDAPLCRMLQAPAAHGICTDCVHVAACGGGCRTTALALSGRVGGLDTSCPLLRSRSIGHEDA